MKSAKVTMSILVNENEVEFFQNENLWNGTAKSMFLLGAENGNSLVESVELITDKQEKEWNRKTKPSFIDALFCADKRIDHDEWDENMVPETVEFNENGQFKFIDLSGRDLKAIPSKLWLDDISEFRNYINSVESDPSDFEEVIRDYEDVYFNVVSNKK